MEAIDSAKTVIGKTVVLFAMINYGCPNHYGCGMVKYDFICHDSAKTVIPGPLRLGKLL